MKPEQLTAEEFRELVGGFAQEPINGWTVTTKELPRDRRGRRRGLYLKGFRKRPLHPNRVARRMYFCLSAALALETDPARIEKISCFPYGEDH